MYFCVFFTVNQVYYTDLDHYFDQDGNLCQMEDAINQIGMPEVTQLMIGMIIVKKYYNLMAI